jgi:putative endonuclease
VFEPLRRLAARFKSTAPLVSPSTERGSVGERLAAVWLQREKGFRGIVHNWRSPQDRRLELDLVADDEGVVVFVEVKTRPADARVPGYYSAVRPRKKRALLQAARDYLRELRTPPRTIRFDVVEVITGPGSDQVEILHFENVPLFPKEFLRRG